MVGGRKVDLLGCAAAAEDEGRRRGGGGGVAEGEIWAAVRRLPTDDPVRFWLRP